MKLTLTDTYLFEGRMFLPGTHDLTKMDLTAKDQLRIFDALSKREGQLQALRGNGPKTIVPERAIPVNPPANPVKVAPAQIQPNTEDVDTTSPSAIAKAAADKKLAEDAAANEEAQKLQLERQATDARDKVAKAKAESAAAKAKAEQDAATEAAGKVAGDTIPPPPPPPVKTPKPK